MSIEKWFKEKLKSESKRTGRNFKDLYEYLNDSTFFSDPASNKYHNNFPGGLADHVKNVCETIEKYLETKIVPGAKETKNFSPIVVAIGHDITKIGQYDIKKTGYKDGKGQWVDKFFYLFKSDLKRSFDHKYLSVKKIKAITPISEIEETCIYWAEGRWSTGEEFEGVQAFSNALLECPYLHITNSADMIASKYLEKVCTDEELTNEIKKSGLLVT